VVDNNPDSIHHSEKIKVMSFFLPKKPDFQSISIKKHLTNTLEILRNQLIKSKKLSKPQNQTKENISSSTYIWFLGYIEVYNNHHKTPPTQWNPLTLILTILIVEKYVNDKIYLSILKFVKLSPKKKKNWKIMKIKFGIKFEFRKSNDWSLMCVWYCGSCYSCDFKKVVL